MPEEDAKVAASLREMLYETAASADEELMDKYFETMELTEEEISFLHRLGECAFLPVIQEKEAPVFPEEAGKELLLQCLEKKGLISLDYVKPLKDYHTPAYDASPVRGSMALTKRGQDVLELMEYQGVRS